MQYKRLELVSQAEGHEFESRLPLKMTKALSVSINAELMALFRGKSFQRLLPQKKLSFCTFWVIIAHL